MHQLAILSAFSSLGFFVCLHLLANLFCCVLHFEVSHSNGCVLICQAYMALNDVDAAVESFEKALKLEPNDGTW